MTMVKKNWPRWKYLTVVTKNDRRHEHEKWPRSPELSTFTKHDRGQRNWPRSEILTVVTKNDHGGKFLTVEWPRSKKKMTTVKETDHGHLGCRRRRKVFRGSQANCKEYRHLIGGASRSWRHPDPGHAMIGQSQNVAVYKLNLVA